MNENNFLTCHPAVFVVNNMYQITVLTKENGIISVCVGNKEYFEENTGVLASEKNYAKILIPQEILDVEKFYSVCFRRCINRKSYFSQLGEKRCINYDFKPLLKEKDICICHLADTHGQFDAAKSAVQNFESVPDLYIVNGDLFEPVSEEAYYKAFVFLGEIGQGKVPVLFARGNHEARGKFAEKYANYFPCVYNKTYYEFEFGILAGVVLDCGEDKVDSHAEYGNCNLFHAYREGETNFLKTLKEKKSKIYFAVSHICPVQPATEKNGPFDIERNIYSVWNKELERLGISFMLCGHIHSAYILSPNDERSFIRQNYSVIVGSAFNNNFVLCSEIILNKNCLELTFRDSVSTHYKTHKIELQTTLNDVNKTAGKGSK